MSKMRRAAFLLALFVYGGQALADSEFSHSILELPFVIETDAPWYQVIDSQQSWQNFYSEKGGSVTESSAEGLVAPQIDFDTFSIVVGGLGYEYRASKIVIQSVEDRGGVKKIRALILRPDLETLLLEGRICWVPMSSQFPTIAVLIPKPEGEVVISSHTLTMDCNALYL